MQAHEIHELLVQTGALLDGHFDLGNHQHCRYLIRPSKALQFPIFNRKLCFEIVRHYLELDIHVVVAMSVGAIPAAVEVGRQLEARTIFVENNSDTVGLLRGFELHDGERTVIVADVLTHDSQLTGLTSMIRRFDARLIGVGSIIDCRSARKGFAVKNVSAFQLQQELYASATCSLCASSMPLLK